MCFSPTTWNFESSLYYSDISHTGGIYLFNIFKSNDVLMLNSTDARIDVSDLIRQVEIENLGSCIDSV